MSDERITLRQIRKWSQAGQRFAMLTCYDATTAHWLYEGGLRTILVGDTAAQMVLGYDSTLPMTMDFQVAITAAVRRGAPNAMIMADMPFGSYQAGDDQAVSNTMRFLKEGMADCVKLEVDDSFTPLVERLSRAGVPVVAHIGSRPQQVRHKGTCMSVGKTEAEADVVVETAKQMIEAGADVLLIEAVPAEVSQRVVDIARRPDGRVVPVIGCGAGPACHGHVVVLHDLVGLTDWHPPFVKPVDSIGERLRDVAAGWVDLVSSGKYLVDDHPYKMK